VVAHESGITAYTESDGKQVWQTTPPDSGGKFCGAGTRVVNGQVAVAFGKELDQQKDPVCKFAALLDVKTGKLGWQQPMNVPEADSSPGRSRNGAALEIMGDIVVIAQYRGTVGLDLATGAQRWAKAVVKPTGNDDGASTIQSMMPGKQSLIVSISGNLSSPALTFAKLDPATGALGQGKDYSTKDGDNRFTTPEIVSTDPPIAVVHGNTGAIYFVMDDNFGKVGLIDAGRTGGPDSLHVDSLGVDTSDSRSAHGRFLVSDGLFVTVTSIPLNGTNKLVAYDIASGKRKWERPIPDGKAIMPLAVANGSVVTLVSPAKNTDDQRIARFSLTDGSPGAVEKYPLVGKSGDSPSTNEYQLFYHDDRLWAVRGPSNEYAVDAFSIGK
jgi:outer membrane protein assembly factor BamB